MRSALWPETDDGHLVEIGQFFAGEAIDVEEVLIAEQSSSVVGFLEINLRNFAEGSRQAEVPYVEAWFVKPAFQGQGVGKSLMREAEKWALTRGYTELASDTEMSNQKSIAAHRALGFREVDRIVCFLKKLGTS